MTVPELHERWSRDGASAPGPRRARAHRVGRGPHPRLGPRPLPRPPRAARTRSTRRGRSRRSAPPASAARSRRACSSARAPSTSSTSSTAASGRGRRRAGRSSAERRASSGAAAGLSRPPAQLRRRDLEDAGERVERRGEVLDAGLAVDLEHHGDGRHAGDRVRLELPGPDALRPRTRRACSRRGPRAGCRGRPRRRRARRTSKASGGRQARGEPGERDDPGRGRTEPGRGRCRRGRRSARRR